MEFYQIFDNYMTDNNISSYRMANSTGISASLIGYWRKGERKPTLENLKLISDFLKISTDYLIRGESSSSILLNNEIDDVEKELLKYYKLLDDYDKIRFLERLKTTIDIKNEIKEDNEKSLKAVDCNSIQLKPAETKEMKVSVLSASAGLGNYLNEDNLFETMTFDKDKVPLEADYGIRIQGDSMEPSIHNGEIVWVKEQVQIKDGQIGIFVYEGEAYCKKLRIDYSNRTILLISLNSAFQPIKITDSEGLKTVGKVLL